jgi:hypothetical protein
VKILQTLEGGLRLDNEDEGDWQLLDGIARDAVSCDEHLASRLGKLITDEEVAADWREYIIPDLEEGFHSDLSHVAASIAAARLEAAGGPGPLWITRDEGLQWYSALNQARLAIEERFHFGPSEDIDAEDLPPVRRSAFLRSQFYCAIQSLLLDQVMR